MNHAALDRLEYLLGQATPAPWVRANLANITTEIIHGRAWVQGEPAVIKRLKYGPYDDALCTEAVNALPALIAIARTASGIEARQRADPQGLDPEGESPVAATSGETPNLSSEPPAE